MNKKKPKKVTLPKLNSEEQIQKQSKFKVKDVIQQKNKFNDNLSLQSFDISLRYTNNFKINLTLTNDEIKHESINNAIHEYLLKMNLSQTLQAFQNEISKKQFIKLENFPKKLKNALEQGNSEVFFNLWCKYIPLSLRIHDKTTVITEFFMNVYFSIYKLQPHFKKSQKDFQQFPLDEYQQVINDFKKYLVAQGDELTKIDELLPYFALPYLKEPHQHPFFKKLFSEEWLTQIKQRLDTFLKSIYNQNSKPFLLTLYENQNKQNSQIMNNSLLNEQSQEINQYCEQLEKDNQHLTSIIEELNQEKNNISDQFLQLKKKLEDQEKFKNNVEDLLQSCQHVIKQIKNKSEGQINTLEQKMQFVQEQMKETMFQEEENVFLENNEQPQQCPQTIKNNTMQFIDCNLKRKNVIILSFQIERIIKNK